MRAPRVFPGGVGAPRPSPAHLHGGDTALQDFDAFSGSPSTSVGAARTFYADTLGLRVTEENGRLTLHLAGEGGERPTLVYPKPNHEPASFTILNFPVDDIEAAVDELTAKGVIFETYAGTPMETDAKGVFRKEDRSSRGSPTRPATSSRSSRHPAPADPRRR